MADMLYILDAIGPFFQRLPEGRINWSKIPFSLLEKGGVVDHALFEQVRHDFASVCVQAEAFGFNALSIDDVAHLHDHAGYPAELRSRIQSYQREYLRLFEVAVAHGLDVYVTTDIMFHHSAIDDECGNSTEKLAAFMAAALDGLFARFPQVKGIISRIGESDGLDVEGDFHSRLTIRTPRQARKWLKALIPVFEKHQRRWIFRTWSVGAYRVGDLIWNRDTLNAIFRGIQSPCLVLSMKHGESDFFRYLAVNKNLFRGHLPRIVEVQARREYEGAGQFPSFIGSELERFQEALAGNELIAGAMVWCQTGGWIRFRRRSFIDPDAVWNEINTWIAIRVLRHRESPRQAVESWRLHHAAHLNGERLYTLLELSSDVAADLLYIDEFARRKVFFRRLRIPPLLAVYWDHVIVNHSMRQILRCYVQDGESVIRRGYRALEKIDQMAALARELNLNPDDFVFMRDTFRIMAAAREYYFREFSAEISSRLECLRAEYRLRHPRRYSIHLNFVPVRIRTARLRWLLRVLFREKRGYRLVDRIFTIRILSWIYPLLSRVGRNYLPEFSRRQAMGIDSIFR